MSSLIAALPRESEIDSNWDFAIGPASNSNGKMVPGSSHVRTLRKWATPSEGVRPSDSFFDEELVRLLECLPQELSYALREKYVGRLHKINEIFLQLGLIPEVIVATNDGIRRECLGDEPCTEGHLRLFADFFAAGTASVTSSKRRGIAKTLHRVSLITDPTEDPEPVTGVAVRVGRSLEGLLETMTWGSFLYDLAAERRSLLLIGKPGVGKTTALRQIAKVLSDKDNLVVVVVDKTCEIAGDGKIRHPAIGRSRWMKVGVPGKQHDIMREAVENQSPDVIIVDEISTPQEVLAARTISQRGVMLIASVHGVTLPEIVHCKERGNLVGGLTSVTLSGREADRRPDKRKQVLKRAQDPVFGAALELHTRTKWIFHPNIREASDNYLDGQDHPAVELNPGVAYGVASIPIEGSFEYCRDCAARSNPCSLHYRSVGAPAPATPAPTPAPKNKKRNKAKKGGAHLG